MFFKKDSWFLHTPHITECYQSLKAFAFLIGEK